MSAKGRTCGEGVAGAPASEGSAARGLETGGSGCLLRWEDDPTLERVARILFAKNRRLPLSSVPSTSRRYRVKVALAAANAAATAASRPTEADIQTQTQTYSHTQAQARTGAGIQAQIKLQASSGIAGQELEQQTPHGRWVLKRVLAGHLGWVRAVEVDVSNEWFATGANDSRIKIWDLASGRLRVTLTGHAHAVQDLKISESRPYLFSASEDHSVKCWDLEHNKVVRHYHGHLSGVYTLALHPRLDLLISAGRDSTVRVWDVRERKPIFNLEGHTNAVHKVVAQAFDPQIISASADRCIRTWDLRTGTCGAIKTHHSKGVRALALLPPTLIPPPHPGDHLHSNRPSGDRFGSAVVSACAEAVKVWRPSHSTQPVPGNIIYERDLAPCHAIVNTLAVKSEAMSATVVAGTNDGYLHFWDYKSGRLIQSVKSIAQPGALPSENAIFALAFDRSETRLLTAECDKSIKVWHLLPHTEGS